MWGACAARKRKVFEGKDHTDRGQGRAWAHSCERVSEQVDPNECAPRTGSRVRGSAHPRRPSPVLRRLHAPDVPPTGVLCAAVLCDPRPANLQAAPCMLCAAPDRHTSTLRAWGRLWGPASCRALARSQPPIRTGAAHQLCGKSPDRALGSRMARTLAA